jgi:hypothetical protein
VRPLGGVTAGWLPRQANTYAGVKLRTGVGISGVEVDAEYERVLHQPTHISGKTDPNE